LKPANPGHRIEIPKGTFQIRQEHKRFDPHILAITIGSSVAFPNYDPFLHNVFSMFDGKRFDLGLYESGASHSVRIERAGVSFIFCNIHPEMSAVVVVVESPYYALSDPTGQFSIPNVPPGNYVLSVWHERGKPENPSEFPREITVSAESASLRPIRLVDAGGLLLPHKNKYGRDYDPGAGPTPIYKPPPK
jgi:plastocyanin